MDVMFHSRKVNRVGPIYFDAHCEGLVLQLDGGSLGKVNEPLEILQSYLASYWFPQFHADSLVYLSELHELFEL